MPHRQVLNGIFWILRTGAPWRDLPERHGKWQTVYDRFSRWRREGLFQHRRRNVVERRNGHLKENRRIATRYEKPAVNFIAMIQLAFIAHPGGDGSYFDIGAFEYPGVPIANPLPSARYIAETILGLHPKFREADRSGDGTIDIGDLMLSIAGP